MPWTLLVPGALLPAALAPTILSALPPQAADLPTLLRAARAGSPLRYDGDGAPAPWRWLGDFFGLGEAARATAPYAFHADAPPDPSGPRRWISHASPVHLAVARDHISLMDLEDALPTPEEERQLLALANTAAAPAGLGFVARSGRWYAVAARPWALQTVALRAVAGRSVQDHLPTGADERRWRVLLNEIQMAWHESAPNAAREARGMPPVNGIWLDGGGNWAALGPAPVRDVRVPSTFDGAATVRGWMAAAQRRQPDGCLSVFDGWDKAHARQDWNGWLASTGAFCIWLRTECAQAEASGAAQVRLVLLGTRGGWDGTLPLQAAWWQRALTGGRSGAGALARLLTEADAQAA